MARNRHLQQTVVLGQQRRDRDDPEKIDRVARCRGVQISGKRNQDKEQLEDKVRDAGESDFRPGENRRQRWRRAVPAPPDAKYHRRKNS